MAFRQTREEGIVLTQAMILAVMLAMQPGFGDERATDEERRAFLEPVAAVILQVASEAPNPIRTASVLLALGKNETRFASYVLEGRCQDGPPGERCDWSRRTNRPVARGPFQVHPWCKGAWSVPETSIESLVGGARCAVSLVNRALERCLKTRHAAWEGAFAVYRGQTCADGTRTGGSNYKGRRYAKSLVQIERRLKLDVKAIGEARVASEDGAAPTGTRARRDTNSFYGVGQVGRTYP